MFVIEFGAQDKPGGIMEFEVIDNYLSEENHKRLASNMLSPEFPWYFNTYEEKNGEIDGVNNYQFTHNFYMNLGWVSDWAYLIYPFIDLLSPRALVRIKANLSPSTEENLTGRWHTDYDFECKTAVYYINDNDGWTQFKSGERVESVANRMVIFNSQNLHVGATATNVKARCLINFNYM